MLFLLAERNDRIIHIDEITPDENGLKCKCICPICKEPLKANTLGKIKRKHFSHNINSDCINHLETAIHKLAKQIIEENRRIVIPKLIYNDKILVPEQNINFIIVESEKYLSNYNIKPDIIGTAVHNNKKMYLIIEIVITHKIDENKLKKIKKSNLSTIEIYLDPKEISKLSFNEIKHIILNSTSNKKWIYNKYAASKIEKYNILMKQIIIQKINREKQRLKSQKYYKLKHIYWSKSFNKNKKYDGHVYKCPKSTLEEHDLRIANIDECSKCIYFAGFITEDWRKISVKCKGNYYSSIRDNTTLQ